MKAVAIINHGNSELKNHDYQNMLMNNSQQKCNVTRKNNSWTDNEKYYNRASKNSRK